MALIAPPPATAAQLSPGRSLGGSDWTTFWAYLELIDGIVVEARPPFPPALRETEAGNLQYAEAIASSFAETGIRSGISMDARLKALSAIAFARGLILDNPDLFLDSGWQTVLVTLDNIEIALTTSEARS